ncbi:MAG: ketopantoate reductase family protein [Gemmatimonadota bacterium]
MKVLVLGAGAVGGYFGGRLAEAGTDVTFLVREARRKQLEASGLKVRSPAGDIELAVRTVTSATLRPEFDLLLLTCKAYDLTGAIDSLAALRHSELVVLPLLNGMSHLSVLDSAFGVDRVMGGTCALNVSLTRGGAIVHQGSFHRLVFGTRSKAAAAVADAFEREIARTTVSWERSPDVAVDMWEKIVVLSTLAAATCLFRASIGEIHAAPGGPEAIEHLFSAARGVAAREGYPLRPSGVEFARRVLFDSTSSLTASMLRDVEGGNPVESEQIVGYMLERARGHGIDASLLSHAYTHLKAYEARRSAGRLPSREVI